MTPPALNDPIGITPQASPADYIDDWSPAIFVPLVDETLNSKFYGRLAWRDILPDHPRKEFDLGEFPMVAVWIKFDRDAKGRLFVNVRYADGQTKRLEAGNPVTVPAPVASKAPVTRKAPSKWIDITKVKSYYTKADLAAMTTKELQRIKEEILNAYKQFDYIYTDTNVWIYTKVEVKKDKRYVSTPNLASIEQLTNMMPELGAIHYLHQFVRDEIEIMQKGVHKERFKCNSEKNKEEYISREKQRLASLGKNFDEDEYERVLGEWKKKYRYEEKLQEEDDLKKAAKNAMDTYKELKRVQEERGVHYFITLAADLDNKVKGMDDASNAADKAITKSIIEFYKQGKKSLLITDDNTMWNTLCDIREMDSLIPGTGDPNPDMPPQHNVARLKSRYFKGHMLALSNIDKILSSRQTNE